jgi:hypothetical protein
MRRTCGAYQKREQLALGPDLLDRALAQVATLGKVDKAFSTKRPCSRDMHKMSVIKLAFQVP